MSKRYDAEKVEALLRWVETGMVDEADGAGYELAQAVRESAVEERAVEGWAVVPNVSPDRPYIFFNEGFARERAVDGRKLMKATLTLHDAPAPGEEG